MSLICQPDFNSHVSFMRCSPHIKRHERKAETRSLVELQPCRKRTPTCNPMEECPLQASFCNRYCSILSAAFANSRWDKQRHWFVVLKPIMPYWNVTIWARRAKFRNTNASIFNCLGRVLSCFTYRKAFQKNYDTHTHTPNGSDAIWPDQWEPEEPFYTE